MSEERLRCYTTGDEIKFLDTITEEDKPEFQELTDDQLMGMFKDMISVKDDTEGEQEPKPHEEDSRFNYSIYDQEWYAMKFRGFPNDVYDLLVEVDKKENAEPMVMVD